MPSLTRRAALALPLLAAPGLAGAQQAPQQAPPPLPPLRIRGRIARFEGEVLTVAAREGGEQALPLAPSVVVTALQRVPLGDLAPGTPLGVVAVPADDGLRAVAITVLPPTATRQFQSDWDLSAGSSMNNGAVEGVMERAGRHELALSINGRSVPVLIDDRTAIVRPIPASRDDLKPGAAVFIFANRGADGRAEVLRVSVEKDGVAPPT